MGLVSNVGTRLIKVTVTVQVRGGNPEDVTQVARQQMFRELHGPRRAGIFRLPGQCRMAEESERKQGGENSDA